MLGVSNCYVFKSRLQEYAQKVGIPTPVYETTKEGPSHEPSFWSTVIVNDVRYDSLPGFFNRKAAEQSAAEVALMQLAKSGELSERISQPIVSFLSHRTNLILIVALFSDFLIFYLWVICFILLSGFMVILLLPFDVKNPCNFM